MIYFYQDVMLTALNFLLFLYLVGYLVRRRRAIHKENFLLVTLTFLLATVGLADTVSRWNLDPVMVLLSNSLTVFGALFTLTILLHYSLFSFTRAPFFWPNKFYLLLYLPCVALSFVYALTPLMVMGIILNPFGVQLVYSPGYWLVVAAGLALAFLALIFEVGVILKNISRDEKQQGQFSLIVLLLVALFYLTNLILPFALRGSIALSPLPVTLAIFISIYGFIRYHFYSLEKM